MYFFYMYSDLNGNDLKHICVVIGPIIFILFIFLSKCQ